MQRLYTEHALRKVCEPAPLWQIVSPEKTLGLVPGTVPMDSAEEVTYVKTVTCAGTVRFVFGGSNAGMRAYLDGELLGESVDGRPFDAYRKDLPYEAHQLTVQLDAGAKSMGTVTMEQLGCALVTAMDVTTGKQGKATVASVTVTVKNMTAEEKTVDADVKVASATMHWKNRVLPGNGEVTMTGTLPVPGAKPWTMDHPRQMAAEIVLWCDGEPIDDLRSRVCFRTVETKEECLTVNGEEQKLQTVSLDAACTLDAALLTLQSAKKQGCNAVTGTRHDLRLQDLCDQLGLIVLD